MRSTADNNDRHRLIPLAICAVLLLLTFVASSVFSAKLRGKPAVSIPVLALYSVSWSGLVVVGSTLLFESNEADGEQRATELAVVFSVM